MRRSRTSFETAVQSLSSFLPIDLKDSPSFSIFSITILCGKSMCLLAAMAMQPPKPPMAKPSRME
jgi:hypothetical protein